MTDKYIQEMAEKWKDIEGWEGFYQASNAGRIRSVDRTVKHGKSGKISYKSRIICLTKSPQGYTVVPLTRDSKTTSKTVHRIVAIAFIPKQDGKDYVNHINGVKSDNRVENLEWCTMIENNTHAFKTGLREHRRYFGRYAHLHKPTQPIS